MRKTLMLGLTFLSLTSAAIAREKPTTRPASAALEGLWSGASFTELERPDELKALVLTPDQAHAWETKLKPSGGVNVGSDELGQATSEFPETGSGLLRMRGEIRSSILIEPADGKLPFSAAAKADLGIEPRRRRGYDNVEARPQDERCLSSDTGGAPSIPTADANVIQILEAPGHVVILAERYHDARIVRLDRDRVPHSPPSWLGDSTGRWEGDVLVVETSNYRPGLTQSADRLVRSPQTRVVERFTRTSPTQIHYEFTVTDPYLYTQPIRGEYVFGAATALYEYACHEGNYSIVNILAAARLGLQDPPRDAPAASPTP
jgi:hypothetical protein